MANGLPRFQRGTQVAGGGGVVNPAAGAEQISLIQIIDRFEAAATQRVQQQGLESAAQEGFDRGTQSDELQEVSGITSAGRAFNQAARAAHVANVRLDIKTRLGEQIIEAQKLPAEQWVDAFIATSDGLKDGILEGVDPSVRGDALAYFNDTASGLRLKLLGGQESELRRQTGQELESGLEALFNDIVTAARELNEGLLTARQQEFETVIQQGIDSGLVAEGRGLAMIQNMHSAAVQGEILGGFETVLQEDIEEGHAALARFKREKASALGLSAEEKDQLTTTMAQKLSAEQSAISQAAARAKAAAAAKAVGLTRRATDSIKMLNAGFPVDIEDLAGELAATGKHDRLTDLAAAVDMQGKVSAFNTLRVPEQQAILDGLREQLQGGKLDPADFNFMERAERAHNRTVTMLKNDPRTLAREQQVITDDPELFQDGASLADVLAQRAELSAQAEEHYGQKIPALTQTEAQAIGSRWASAGIEDKLAISSELVAGLGADAGEVLSMLDKKGYRMAGFTGGLVLDGKADTARAVLRGVEAITVNNEVMPQGVQGTMLDQHIGAMLGKSFAFLPEFRASSIEAAKAWYADRAAIEGDFTGEFNRPRMDRAIEATIGNIVEDNAGNEFAIQDIDQTQFDRWISAIDADMIKAAGGVQGWTDEAAAEQLRRARVIAIGNGVLRFSEANPHDIDNPGFFFNTQGQPFELTVDPDVAGPPGRRADTIGTNF